MTRRMTAGDKFKRDFLAEFQSDRTVDLQAVDVAAALLDEIEAMEAKIAEDGLVVDGSQGQPVAHPLVAQVRLHRKSLTDLLRTLTPDGSASNAGRSLAQKKWQKNGSRFRPNPHTQRERDQADRVYVPMDYEPDTDIP